MGWIRTQCRQELGISGSGGSGISEGRDLCYPEPAWSFLSLGPTQLYPRAFLRLQTLRITKSLNYHTSTLSEHTRLGSCRVSGGGGSSHQGPWL